MPKEFIIWKVTAKAKANWPDYIIKAKNEQGEYVKIGAGWKKNSKKVDEKGNPVTFIACRLEEQEKPKEQPKQVEVAPKIDYPENISPDDIPF